MASDTAPPNRCQVLILGAGMSGLCMAIALRRSGIDDFVVLEKSAGIGGTWWDNRYPGAHVDVPAPLYSFSFASNPGWTRRFAAAPEVQDYQQVLARRHGLLPHIRLGCTVAAASFDEPRGRWLVETAAGERYDAGVFVCSTGPLSQARWPDIPGLSDFEGTLLHAARWDPAVPLDGARVGVIGTGSTASQLVPPLAARAARLHVFQRTAHWVLPRIDRPYTALDRALARLPPYNRLVRAFWYQVLEWGRRGFDEGTLARRGMQRAAAAHLRRGVADATLRGRLQPPYPLGCKRIVYSNDYYPALARPNVELVTDGIERITPHGIVTADGRERLLDVLVCATGFDVEHSLQVPISGRGGLTLAAAWAEGPRARLGLTVPGFPNLFLMLGPNTATGHTSTLLYIEPAVQWVMQALAELRRRGARWLDLKPSVLQAFDDEMQRRLAHAVWSGCRSWYLAGNGRNIAIWPGFTGEYARRVRTQDFADFEFG